MFKQDPAIQRLEDPGAEEALGRLIAGALPAMISFWRHDLTCAFANGAYRRWLGRPMRDMLGLHIRDLMGDTLYALNQPHIEAALAGEDQHFQRTLIKPDGSTGHILTSYFPQRDADGKISGFIAQTTDVTPLEETRQRLALAALVFDGMTEGVIVDDLDGVAISVNSAFMQMSGFCWEDVIGKKTHFLGLDQEREKSHLGIESQVIEKGFWRGDIWSRKKNGEAFLVEQTTTLTHGPDKQPLHYVSLMHDVTNARSDLTKLRYRAQTDALTGLMNRSALFEQLDALIAGSTPFVLLFVDLDGFKTINDIFGHDFGDQVLALAAKVLTASVRDSDFVARLAGDEFVVILTNRTSREEVSRIAYRIESSLAETLCPDGTVDRVGASMGSAFFPEEGSSANQLLAAADKAMYSIKNERKAIAKILAHA